MPPKKPVPARAPAKPAAKPAAGKPTAAGTGRGAPAKRGAPAAGAKKGAAAAPAKGKAEPAKPKVKEWTKQDTAARTIQTKVRQMLAKKALAAKKKEKQDYEDLMDKLEKEAFVKIIKMEQEEAERQRKKEEEERKKRQQEIKRKKRMLEASFDGDNDEIQAVLQEVRALYEKTENDALGNALKNKHLYNTIECEDPNGNTPLSEAANGGHVETIQLLLELGADPNTQGQFKRTPLYRAAFAGHLQACQVLLVNGADPRIYADDSQTPQEIASQQPVVELLQGWDVSQTDVLMKKLESAKEKRMEEERNRLEAEQSKLEASVATVQEEFDVLQKQLNRAYCELNKRIEEHDQGVASGFDRPEVTLQAVHDAEDEVEIVKLKFEKANEKLSLAKLKLREQIRTGQAALDEELPGLKVLVRELEDVLLRDVGNKIKDSGKWPLIIDPNAQAATFLRYRDTNYINALSPAQMETDKARLCILGAIRYGKPLVLDMMEVDMFDTVAMKFDDISKGLMDKIMDKTILHEENYLPLVKKEDGPMYERNQFNDMRTQRFSFFIITKNPYPPEALVEKTYLIRLFVPT